MTNDRQYKTTKCKVCGKQISTGGAAYASHMRVHVKNKELLEFNKDDKLVFMTEKEYSEHLDNYPYALIGEEQMPQQPKDIWEIPDLKESMPAIDPHSYFITSGEGVKKAEKLVKDVYSLAIKARALRDKLLKCRGKKKYLETSHENNKLIVKAKDPRNRS
jgi:cytosine/adenosine deaminase-related metal-dependent hydrolase